MSEELEKRRNYFLFFGHYSDSHFWSHSKWKRKVSYLWFSFAPFHLRNRKGAGEQEWGDDLFELCRLFFIEQQICRIITRSGLNLSLQSIFFITCSFQACRAFLQASGVRFHPNRLQSYSRQMCWLALLNIATADKNHSTWRWTHHPKKT